MIQDKINEFLQLIELKSFTIDEIKIWYFNEPNITHGQFKTPDSFKAVISPLSKSISIGLNDLDLKNLKLLKKILNEYLNDCIKISKESQDFYIQNGIEINVIPIEHSSSEKLLVKDLSDLTLKIVQAFWKFKEESLQTLISSIDEQLKNKTFSTIHQEKMELKLAVADIALLFRLLDEESLINYKHKTEIYRYIANCFKTEKQDDISEASIKNKFLSPDNTSIKNLDILLTNLKIALNKLN